MGTQENVEDISEKYDMRCMEYKVKEHLLKASRNGNYSASGT